MTDKIPQTQEGNLGYGFKREYKWYGTRSEAISINECIDPKTEEGLDITMHPEPPNLHLN